MMDDLRTRALLVDFDRAGAVGTVVSRAEIAEAADGDEFPATLLLDLDKAEVADGAEVAAHARVAVDWERESLEQLLSATDDQDIELWFDERELALAFDERDVEGHGFRQRAAVLTLTVAAAGVSSSPALARMAADNSGAAGGVAAAGIGANPRIGDQGPPGAVRALQLDERLSGDTVTVQPAATSSSSDSTLSTGELAAAVAGGAVLIAAAGFGVSRKRTPPALPA